MLTLFITPVLYLYMERLSDFLRGVKHEPAQPAGKGAHGAV
jgi:hypothetical protein